MYGSRYKQTFLHNGRLQQRETYKLAYGGTEKIYIGSTSQMLYNILADHKCVAAYEHKHGCTSRLLFEKGNVKITLLEDYPSERKEHLLARARHWIETLPNISYQIPTRTSMENPLEKSVCEKCGLELLKHHIQRHQSRSLCQAVAEMRPTKKTKEM